MLKRNGRLFSQRKKSILKAEHAADPIRRAAASMVETLEKRTLMSTSWTVSDLADFNGNNGENPIAGVYRDSSGNLWGTTYGGGTSSDGTIYKIAAGTNTVTTILNFNGTNGSGPWGDLVADSSGNIYGTTSEGGAYTYGTVYKIAAGTNTVTTLDSFNGTDGAYPDDGLFLDSNGNLWGTTESHGANGVGTVFKIASGSSSISLVNSFSSTTGAQPIGGLIVDSSGNVYGTTNSAGSGAGGTVFEIPSGSSNINVLATFSSSSGYGPYAGLVRDSAGNLYGTTTSGGANGDGTVFELASGGNSITPLASFNGTNGSDPNDALVIDSSGNLYGTTVNGGPNSDGAAFEVAAGSGTITTLASFNGTNGNQPRGKLTMDSSGNLYGTTYSGGANSDGNIFELTPHTSSQLAFTSVPSSITAGTAQSINVSVEDTGGTTVTNDTSTVTLSIASGPSGGTIGGTTSVSAVAGVATFSGLTFTKAGTYTLTAAANGLTSATSTTITVTAASASKLAIVQQPTTGSTYHTLGSIVVNVEDQYGNLVTGNTATVTLSSTTTLSGTTSVAAVAGVATFSNVWVASSGSFTLTAASSGLTSASTSSIAVSPEGLTTLVSLNNTTGKNPQMGLIMDSSGNLYGTATAGGSGTGGGTAFEVAAGTHAVTVLESGGAPYSGLVMDSSGNLYGTTTTGGTYGDGSIYEIPAGTSNATTLASFNGTNGEIPANFMVIDSSGNLYGVASTGGANSDGTVFELAHGSSTITLLASFNGTNGRVPYGGVVLDSSGNLYGTAESGGASGDGTIWEVNAGSGTITVLASFNGTNGAAPNLTNLVRDSSGDLYGTTNGGGAYGDGAVFELPHGSSTITALASFNGSNGNDGQGLVMDANGNFYGVTSSGGANNQGVVWMVAAGTSVITDLVTFTGSTNGSAPIDRLLMDSSGNLYGTTDSGGASGGGTVFELGPVTDTAVIASQPTNAVAGVSQSITVNLNTTGGALDTTNQSPVTLSILSGPSGGTLGGTTTVSADNGVASFTGLTFNKVGTYVLQANSNGAFSGQTTSITVTAGTAAQVVFTTQPVSAMSGQSLGPVVVSVEDSNGNLVTTDNSTVTLSATDGSALLGTTSVQAVNGVATFNNPAINALGSHTLHAADGSLTAATSNSITVSARSGTIAALASFNGTNGSNPYGAMVIDSQGDLFGTTQNGGANNDGTVFEITAGSGTITTIASFNSSTGTNPWGQLMIDSAGNLYGTTNHGGANSDGTVFEVVAGSHTITKIADFSSTAGTLSTSGLIEDSSGNLYGTTNLGGTNSDGTIYKIASGTNTITVLASFNGTNGSVPRGGVVMDSSGNLYGTTTNGGANSDGTVWKLANGSNTITTLASFNGTNGANPYASLVMDSSGNLYGTTSGGSSGVFEVAAGTTTITPLGTGNGIASTGQLLMDSGGNLYGTTVGSGAYGDGTVFEITAGSHSYLKLADLNGTNGSTVQAGLVEDSSGNLYGVAYSGGANNDGTVFEVTPPPPVTQTVFTSQPTTAVSGASQSFTVDLESASGAIIAQGGTVTLSIASGPTGATLGGTLTATASNGVATFSGITFTKAGTYTLTAASSGTTAGTSGFILVTAGAANKAVVAQAPATAVAGQTMGTVLVDITDSGGNLVTTSTATVTLSGTGLTGTLSAAAVGGVATFNNLIMTTAGSQTITASSSGLTAGTSSAITVSPTVATKLAFTTQPSSAMSSLSLGTVAVTVEDTYGNVVISDNSTVTLTTSDGSTLNGTTSVAAVNGVATFTNLSINVLGSHTLHAVDGSLTTATSNSVTITALGSSIIGLASFSSSTGNLPEGSPVMDSSGNIWGTTDLGGTNNLGTVWELPAGSSTITTIASFSSTTGGNPQSAVVMDSNGNLFGTTTTGGANSDGTVWELAAGASAITRLTSFTTAPMSFSELSLDSSGNLYGTTLHGGTNGDGTIFEIAAGTSTLTTLASFPSSTGNPERGIVADSAGDLFGVTHSGGTSNYGVVYELAHGSSTITTLASFSAWDTGDSNPPIIDSHGNLFLVGYTTLWELPSGSSTLTELVSSFGGTNIDGMVMDSHGNFFGSLIYSNNVYEVPAGSSTAVSLGAFNGINGSAGNPMPDVILSSQGNVYGVAPGGGANNLGTVYTVQLAPTVTQTVFTSQPTTAVSGASQSFTVSLESSSGAVIAQSGTVALSIASGPTGAALGGTLTATATNGVATFSGITFTKAGTYTLTAASNGLTSGTSATITVTAGAATKAVVAQVPSTAVAGQTMGTVLVDITDANGNVVTNSTATVTLSGTSLTGTLSAAAVGGVATFNNLTMTTAGNQTITAAVSGLTSGTSSAIAVGAGAPSKVVFTTQPGSAGSSLSLGTVAVTVEDSYGNVCTTDSSTVTLTTSDGSTLNGTRSVAAVNGVATFTNLSIDAVGSHTLHAADGSLTTATSSSVTITALSSSATKLASFIGTNGSHPYGGMVIDSHGDLFGTTEDGGAYGGGTVFEVAAGTNTITAVASFSSSTGNQPMGQLMIDPAGNLYGTTYYGGANNVGTVFEVVAGSNTITKIADFSLTVGTNPTSGLIEDSSGNLYGTAQNGGADNEGTIFKIASGSHTITVLASFNGTNGNEPLGGVVMDSSGNLYGTTGYDGQGNIWKLARGSSTITTLASFNFTDGAVPSASMVMDSSGNLYGTTAGGMSPVFELAAGTTTITSLYEVTGEVSTGQLLMDSSGNLFFTTYTGYGSVFEITAGSHSVLKLADLNIPNGYEPQAGVVMDSSGNLYGVAYYGGSNNEGTVFEVTPTPTVTQAVFTSQPTTVTAGTSQSFSVSTESAGGAVVAQGGTVTLSIASGPSGATLGGTLTATATNGVATFSGITFTKAGTYTLTAASSGLTSGTSTTITVNPAAANKVAFVQAPTSGTASPTLGNIQVAIEDTYGNTITSSNATVTITGTSNLSGTTSVAAVAGVATFNNLILPTPGTYTLTAASSGVTSATTPSFTISLGAASKLVFAQQPTGASSGGSIGTVKVDVTDSGGNIITSNNSAVTLTISDGSAITGITTVNANSGVATFTGLSVNASGTHILSASDGSLTGALSNSFTITSGSASRLVIIQQPGNITAGQTVSAVEVAIEDAHGNIVTSNTSTVTLTAAGVSGTLTQTAVNGVATFGDLSFTAAGAHTLSFSDGGLTAANSSSFTVTPAAASQLVFAQQPTSAVAGQSIGTVIVDVKDAYGNIVTGNTSAVTLYASSAITGTTTVNAVNGVATFTGLSIHQAGTYTLSATQNGLTSATSSSITITPAAASQLVVLQQPAAITTAGQNIGTVIVNVEDQFGNIVTTNTSAVAVSTTTTLTGTATVNAVNGVATLSGLSIHQAGSYSLTATDGSLTSATTSSFTIVPAAASKLSITQQPTGATVGQAIGTMIVQVQDTYGNVVTTDNSTVSVTTSDSTPLSGATSVQAVNGIATFSGLSTTVAGTRTLSVTDGSLTSATSSSLTITPSAATHLVIAQQPTDTPAGSSLPTVIVQVEDEFGNVVSTDSSTVALSTSTALHGTTSVAAVNGVATFTGLSMNTIGNYSLSATDGSLTGTSSNYFNINPGLASQLVITQQPVATRAGQTIGNVIAQVEDAFGNVVTTDSSTLTLAVTDGATLNGVTSAAAVNGVATFTGLWCPTAGAHTLTVSDGSLTTATSNSFTVVAADPTQLVIAQQPGSSTVAGQNIGTVIVNVEDQYGNVVTSDSTTVTLSSDDGSPILGSTSVAAVNGVATFSGLSLTEAGTHTLFAADGNYRFGETSSFTITPAAASQLVFNQQPTSVNAGQSMGTISVNVEDAFGNLITTNSSTVSIVVSGGATLSGTATAVASGGVATFTGLSINQAGMQSLFASDGSLTPATSNSFAVNHLAGTKLAFVQQPTSAVAGQTIGVVQVNVEDTYGNLVTNDNSSTVTLYSGAAINGTTSATAVNGVVLFSGLSINRAGSYTLSATNGNLTAATSSSFTISPSTANHLMFAQQPNASSVAGQSIGTIHVNVVDQYGNLVTNDSSSITLSSSATLNGTTTATASGGVATFSGLSIDQTGSYTLTATDSEANSATSNSLAITPAAASQLFFAQQPTNTTVGAALNTIMVNVEDQYGNIVTNNQSTVTLTAGAAINGVTSVAVVNGVATFTGLSMTTAMDQRMHATDGSLTSATSNWFSTLPAATSQLVITQQPGNAVAGQSIGTVVVQAEDAYGNVVTGSGTPLNGTAPDTADAGNAVWTANPNITTDGSEVNLESDEDATLPFVPTAGHVYVLSASMNPDTGNTTNWLGMGFVTLSTPPGTYSYFQAANDPPVSLLERDNRQTQAFYGSTGVNGPTAGNLTGYDSYAITLDTTDSNWTVSFAQDGTVFQTGTFSSNPTITGISIGDDNLAGSFRNLLLTQDGTAIYNDQFARGSAPTVTLTTSSGAAISGQTTAPFINGQATFTGLSIDQAGDYTLSATQGSLPAVSTTNIDITPAAPSQLVIAQQPTNTVAGQVISPTVVDVEDAFGNIVTSDNSQISVSSTTALGGTLIVTANQGVAAFDDLSITEAGSAALTVSDGSLTPATSSSFNITAAAPAQLAFAQQPGNAAATQSIGSVVVDVEDPYGNVVTTDNSTVDVSIVGGTPLNGTTSQSTVDGIATFTGLSIDPAGTYTLSATDDALTVATSNSFTIAVGSPTHLVLVQQPTSTVAGQTISAMELEVEDAGGNLVTTDNSSVTVSSDSAVGGTTTVSVSNGEATFSDLSMTLAGSHELSFADASLTGVTTSPFSITPAAAARVVFTQPPVNTTAAGAMAAVIVNVEDAYGNTITTDNSTVDLSIVGGTPLNGSASQSAVDGIATFTGLSVNPAGTYTLSATDGGLTAATSNSFNITVGTPTQLVMVQQPTTTVAGQAISPVEVAVEDAGGNVVTTDNSSVTVAGDATLGGTTTVSVANGLATFSDLSMTLAGSHSLSFTDANLSGATSNPFSVTPAAATQLVFLTQPTGATQSHAIDAFTVAIEDAYGNLVTSDNSTVTMSAADGTPLGGTTSVNAVNGVATFSNLTITKPGSHALLASDGSLTSSSSTSIPVTPALTTLSLTAPASSVTVGQTLQFTASGTDGSGAPIALDPVTWSLATGSVGSIDQNGLFNAGSISSSGGTATIVATCDGTTASMTITVNAIPPVITVNAYAQLVSSSSNTGMLHVEGEQNGTDANLIYTWSIISQPTVDSDGLNVGASAGSPAPLAIFAINGTNAAKNTPVTFLASGQYVLQVVASNGSQSVTSEVQVTAKVNPKVAPAAVAQTTTVAGVQPVGTAQSIRGFVVTFNGPVDPTTAQNVLGYRIQRQYTVNQGRSFWQQLFGGSPETRTENASYKIASAVYDSQTYSVTLTLASPMPVVNGVRLVQVIGAGAHAVLGANGKAIDGDFNGKPGGNFTYRFTMSVAKTVSYKTTSGDLVKLSLSGPGKIVTIMPSNTATPVIDLLDTDPADSILTGTLHK
jgi:uncharacterized repeat protein (TIGR03803 family)